MTEKAKPHFSSQSHQDFVDHDVSHAIDVDRSSIVEEPEFDQVRFDASDHTSSIVDSQSAMLILSTNSDGRLWSSYEGEERVDPITSGVFHFSPPNIRQEYDFTGQTTNIMTSVRSSMIEHLRDRNPEFHDVRLDEPIRCFVRPALARLIEEQNRLVRSGEMGWRSLADANMVRLCVELMSMMTDRKVKTAQPLSHEEIGMTESYLRANFEENIGLEDIAELVGRDVFGFCRAFKMATGETFHQFSLQLRVTEAERMLIHTSASIAEVSFATGFSSQSHLTTTMRKLRGHTPGKVRRDS